MLRWWSFAFCVRQCFCIPRGGNCRLQPQFGSSGWRGFRNAGTSCRIKSSRRSSKGRFLRMPRSDVVPMAAEESPQWKRWRPTGSSFCTSVKTTVNAGLMSPLCRRTGVARSETRPACRQPGPSKRCGRREAGWPLDDHPTQGWHQAVVRRGSATHRARSATWRRLRRFGRYSGGDGPATREPVGRRRMCRQAG